jgi:hypothetical protein
METGLVIHAFHHKRVPCLGEFSLSLVAVSFETYFNELKNYWLTGDRGQHDVCNQIVRIRDIPAFIDIPSRDCDGCIRQNTLLGHIACFGSFTIPNFDEHDSDMYSYIETITHADRLVSYDFMEDEWEGCLPCEFYSSEEHGPSVNCDFCEGNDIVYPESGLAPRIKEKLKRHMDWEDIEEKVTWSSRNLHRRPLGVQPLKKILFEKLKF